MNDIRALIQAVYDHNAAGGTLHIVLDDGNVDDGSLDFCDREIAKGGYGASPERLQAELECLTELRTMTEAEREAAYKAFHATE